MNQPGLVDPGELTTHWIDRKRPRPAPRIAALDLLRDPPGSRRRPALRSTAPNKARSA